MTIFSAIHHDVVLNDPDEHDPLRPDVVYVFSDGRVLATYPDPAPDDSLHDSIKALAEELEGSMHACDIEAEIRSGANGESSDWSALDLAFSIEGHRRRGPKPVSAAALPPRWRACLPDLVRALLEGPEGEEGEEAVDIADWLGLGYDETIDGVVIPAEVA